MLSSVGRGAGCAAHRSAPIPGAACYCLACCLCLFVWVAGLHSGTAGEEPARSQRELELGYFSQVPTWFVHEIIFTTEGRQLASRVSRGVELSVLTEMIIFSQRAARRRQRRPRPARQIETRGGTCPPCGRRVGTVARGTAPPRSTSRSTIYDDTVYALGYIALSVALWHI